MKSYKEQLLEFKANNDERYSKMTMSSEDKAIATLLNLVLSNDGIIGILVDINERLLILEEGSKQ